MNAHISETVSSNGICKIITLSHKNRDAVNNVDLVHVELGRSVTQLTNNWNKGVNHWLKYYVYVRVQPPSAIAKWLGGKQFLALVITRTVSAFWHV